MTDASSLMAGKKGLIMGLANDHSIAWGIARTLGRHGAEMAFTYQGEVFEKRVRPLAESLGAEIILPCDVEDAASVDSVFRVLKEKWGRLDFLVHAIAYSTGKSSKADMSTRRGRISLELWMFPASPLPGLPEAQPR